MTAKPKKPAKVRAADLQQDLRYRRAIALAAVFDMSGPAGMLERRVSDLERAITAARATVLELELQLAHANESLESFASGLPVTLRKFDAVDGLALAAGAPEIDDDPLSEAIREGTLASSELRFARELVKGGGR